MFFFSFTKVRDGEMYLRVSLNVRFSCEVITSFVDPDKIVKILMVLSCCVSDPNGRGSESR